jgi:cobalt/nickel transport system permease protein
MSPIDRAAHLNHWRKKPLIEKALLALGMLVLALVLPPGAGAPLIAVVMSAAAIFFARVPVSLWLSCAAAPMGFLAVGVVSLVLRIDSDGVGLAPGGFAAAAFLAARAIAGVTCLLFLALTTPTTDLIAGLRRLGLPPEVAEIALLMYRFLFILADAALAMDAAQAARLGHVGARRRLRSLGLLIANLLPRAFDRARRMEIGLAARGWHGDMRVLSDAPPATFAGLGAILLTVAATAAAGLYL